MVEYEQVEHISVNRAGVHVVVIVILKSLECGLNRKGVYIGDEWNDRPQEGNLSHSCSELASDSTSVQCQSVPRGVFSRCKTSTSSTTRLNGT